MHETLYISSNSTPIEVLELKVAHTMKKLLCLECNNAGKYLQRHVEDAIEDNCIAPLVDENTNLLTDEIPTIINYLVYN